MIIEYRKWCHFVIVLNSFTVFNIWSDFLNHLLCVAGLKEKCTVKASFSNQNRYVYSNDIFVVVFLWI